MRRLLVWRVSSGRSTTVGDRRRHVPPAGHWGPDPFAPEEGESIAELSGRFPGGTLGETLFPVALPDGSTDLYIRQDRYHAQFAADLPAERAALDAVTQRPLNDRALNDRAGTPAWRDLPSWFVYPELDFNIPLAAHRFMAERAGAREVVEIAGASHALPASQPHAVAEVILRVVKAVA
ncbi:alpha/beta fold hydrolase [Nonomuraea africana]|uniref:Pimeloyl-ACP methyl ester carboxylesterase n=1 Tax=Nonomuraea africana TaxID=46171 RepID=A0ABR9KJA2_9ACTN|nr:alpha/beta fold hydrolase [Nonomuraea africana]MBE1562096.1 pimeloyl-ACP methyl ester carboxylesterase [Nonomuraea africana]